MAPPTEIYNHPADLFVANFTGASDLLAGRVLERQGEFGTIEAEGGHRLTVRLPPAIAAGEPVTIVVRPENVRCGIKDRPTNQFSARVVTRRYEVAQTVYELAVLGARLEAVEFGTDTRHSVDSAIDIVLPPAACWGYRAGGEADLD